MIFHDATILAPGQQCSLRQHDSDRLEPKAVTIFSDMLTKHGYSFRKPIPVDFAAHIELQWTSEHPSAALATFYARKQMATTSVLVSGLDQSADDYAIATMQGTIVKVFSQVRGWTGLGFDLRTLTQRPLIASIPWPNDRVSRDDMMLIADMETCLAAVFFAERITHDA